MRHTRGCKYKATHEPTHERLCPGFGHCPRTCLFLRHSPGTVPCLDEMSTPRHRTLCRCGDAVTLCSCGDHHYIPRCHGDAIAARCAVCVCGALCVMPGPEHPTPPGTPPPPPWTHPCGILEGPPQNRTKIGSSKVVKLIHVALVLTTTT